MGEIHPPKPVLLMLGAFSRHPEALAWGRRAAEQAWGPIALHSEPFPFDDTTYYERDMGGDLRKQFFAFETLIDPVTLPARKIQANRWEQELAAAGEYAEPRPLNLDPGYLTEAKLVLATTKDRDHRIYLRDGVYAEGTLYFHKRQWRPRTWTYPDYRQPCYHAFFSQCRQWLRERVHRA